MRAFNAAVSLLGQWDDHEVRNNWYPGQILEDANYTIKDVDVLSSSAAGIPGLLAGARQPDLSDDRAGRCAMCSCSTCERIVDRTRQTGKPNAA